MTPQFLSVATKRAFVCGLIHPIPKRVDIINDANRQELEQEILCMVHAI